MGLVLRGPRNPTPDPEPDDPKQGGRTRVTQRERDTSFTKAETGEADRGQRSAGATPRTRPSPGDADGLRHGVYAERFLSDEERPLFESFISQLEQDFVFNRSSDFMQVELVAVYFLKLARAIEAGDAETSERLDRMIRCHLKDLKTTKLSREGETVSLATTPAEWATALLERVRQAERNGEQEGMKDTIE